MSKAALESFPEMIVIPLVVLLVLLAIYYMWATYIQFIVQSSTLDVYGLSLLENLKTASCLTEDKSVFVDSKLNNYKDKLNESCVRFCDYAYSFEIVELNGANSYKFGCDKCFGSSKSGDDSPYMSIRRDFPAKLKIGNSYKLAELRINLYKDPLTLISCAIDKAWVQGSAIANNSLYFSSATQVTLKQDGSKFCLDFGWGDVRCRQLYSLPQDSLEPKEQPFTAKEKYCYFLRAWKEGGKVKYEIKEC
jgi:hypothetical protein